MTFILDSKDEMINLRYVKFIKREKEEDGSVSIVLIMDDNSVKYYTTPLDESGAYTRFYSLWDRLRGV